MPITVSVIIPTWNREHTIKRAIESVLNQTYPVLEVLVCDDGSNDSTKAIVDQLIANDQRIVWIQCGRNGRPAIPRNIGIQRSKGDWLAFLDSDDWWEKDKIEKQLEGTALYPEALLVCSNAIRHSDSGTSEPFFSAEKVPGAIALDKLLETNFVICSSMMVKRELLYKHADFPEEEKFKAIEDYTLWLKLCCISPILFINDLLVNYSDIPANSIRRDSLPEDLQKRIISKEVYNWSKLPPVGSSVSLVNKFLIRRFYKRHHPSVVVCLIQRIKSKVKSLLPSNHIKQNNA